MIEIETILLISSVILAGGAGLAGYQLRNLKLDRYDLGGWKAKQAFRGSGLSTDVRTIVFRIDGASSSPQSWAMLLGRLDELHEYLSPFGTNARRPAVEYRTWWGTTRVIQDAPRSFNKHYLQGYIAILEKLAGVHADE